LPFGPLGVIVHSLLVRKKIESLFRFRKGAIERVFS